MTNGMIYLSGGMQHSNDMGAAWRAECSIHLNEMGFNPIDITQLDQEYMNVHGDVFRGAESSNPDVLQRKANIRKHFIDADLRLITEHSDALIILYDESVRLGAGTISECQVAYNHGIPVFLVSNWDDWKTEVPGWLFALSTKIFTSFDELHEYLRSLPEGILTKDVYDNRGTKNQYICSLSGNVFTKTKTHFVSKVEPLYEKDSIDIIKHTNEGMVDRYEFFVNFLNNIKKPRNIITDITSKAYDKLTSTSPKLGVTSDTFDILRSKTHKQLRKIIEGKK